MKPWSPEGAKPEQTRPTRWRRIGMMALATSTVGGTGTYFVHHGDIVAALLIGMTYVALWLSVESILVLRARRYLRRQAPSSRRTIE